MFHHIFCDLKISAKEIEEIVVCEFVYIFLKEF